MARSDQELGCSSSFHALDFLLIWRTVFRTRVTNWRPVECRHWGEIWTRVMPGMHFVELKAAEGGEKSALWAGNKVVLSCLWLPARCWGLRATEKQRAFLAEGYKPPGYVPLRWEFGTQTKYFCAKTLTPKGLFEGRKIKRRRRKTASRNPLERAAPC